MNARQRVWMWGLLITLIAATVLITTAVRAQDVELPIDTIYRGDPGEIIHVATIPADPGVECVAVLESRNNESMHPNNDILVGPVTFTNVETGTFAAAGLTFTATGPIDVAVRLGGDGVFSAGFTLEVTCNPPTTTTTETPSTTSTVPNVTTTAAPPAVTTTTLSPPPVGGIDTGGGACADDSCANQVLASAELAEETTGSLSPLVTWLLIGVVWLFTAGLAWAFIAGATRKEGPYDG